VQSGKPLTATVGSDPNNDTNTSTDRPPFVGRNTFEGPGFSQQDIRVTRDIALYRERASLRLIFEAFNLFNHANYGNNFGFTTNEFKTVAVPTPVCPTCKLQKSTPDSTFSNPVGFINPSSSTLPRAFTAEFGARFSF